MLQLRSSQVLGYLTYTKFDEVLRIVDVIRTKIVIENELFISNLINQNKIKKTATKLKLFI